MTDEPARGPMTPEELEAFQKVPGPEREEWLRAHGLEWQTFRSPAGDPTGPLEPIPWEEAESLRRDRERAARVVADLLNRFTYHPPRPGQPAVYEEIRAIGRVAALRLAQLVPPGRELHLAWTKLEEAVFWANAGVARAQEPPEPPSLLPLLEVPDPPSLLPLLEVPDPPSLLPLLEVPDPPRVTDPHTFTDTREPPIGAALCAKCGWGRTHEIHHGGDGSRMDAAEDARRDAGGK